MCYTIEQVKSLFEEVCSSQKVEVTVPIKLNSRLSTTLGRVRYQRNFWGEYEPLDVEFSHKFLNGAKDEDIKQVVLHEAAHYILLKQTKERHGHDSMFKEMCAKLGCVYDKTKTDIEIDDAVAAEEHYRYLVFCPNCKKVIARRKTKCKLIKEIHRYGCSDCGCKELEVQEN